MYTNVYVLFGGKSVEHDVSLVSAMAVMNALDRDKFNVYPVYITEDGVWCPLGLLKENITHVDEIKKANSQSVSASLGEFLLHHLKADEKNIVFPVLHGPNGEDGTVQGLLDILEVPYVGNEVLSSAVGLDKVVMKDLCAHYEIPQGEYTHFSLHNWLKDQTNVCHAIEESIGYPCYVKPAALGSSVGINRCSNKNQLMEAIRQAFMYDKKVIVEKEIVGREMQISVVGNSSPKSSVVGEFIQEKSFMDYEAKYIDGKLIPVIPARLSSGLSDKMRETALQVFEILNCYGLVRVDFFVTDEDKYYVNEVNTMPGFTKSSMTPILWEKTDHTTYAMLIEKLITLGFKRFEQKQLIKNRR